MKRTYQIDKKKAEARFSEAARTSTEAIQFALPLPEVLELVKKGMMDLALEAVTLVTHALMNWEAASLAGPKNRPDPSRTMSRWGHEKATAWSPARKSRSSGPASGTCSIKRSPSAATSCSRARR